MASKKDLAGPHPLAYFQNHWSRLQWEALQATPPWEEYWQARYQGEHRADVFRGKSGLWYGVVFGKRTVVSKDKNAFLMTVAELIAGTQC